MPKRPNRIAEIRKQQSLSQTDLGERIGAHYVTISKLETGKLALTQEWRAKIADALRVDPSDISPGAQKRRLYVTGSVEGSARVDVWDYHEPNERFWVETDIYTSDGRWIQWLIVNGDALYPVFQHLDLLQIVYEEPLDMRQMQGNLCAIQTENTKEKPIYLGIPTFEHANGAYDIHMLNGPPRREQHIKNIARVSAAIFKPNIEEEQLKSFQRLYLPFREDEDRPQYKTIADWLKAV